jgi:hypothetical protein
MMRLNARTFFLVVGLLLSGANAQVQSQDAATCRSLAMDCFMGCINSSTDLQACKRSCINPHECGFSRDVWSQAHTDWCCACHGQRCPPTG